MYISYSSDLPLHKMISCLTSCLLILMSQQPEQIKNNDDFHANVPKFRSGTNSFTPKFRR